MTFVTPALALAGLAAIAVPILIHLLWRQRRTPIQWAAMRFLLEAYRKHRQRLRLEQWLLLALRCLLLAVAGAALARPFVSGAIPGAGGARTVWLVIDDGLVSGASAPDADGTELDAHRATAHAIVGQLDPGDRLGLVTTARPAAARVAPPSTDHGAVLELVDALEPSAAASDLPAALDRLAGSLATEDDTENTFVYLLSSFRAGAAPIEDPLGEALSAYAETVEFIVAPPATAPIANVRVVSIEPARRFVVPGTADGSGRVRVRLERSGDALERGATTLRLLGDGIEPIEPRTVEWLPGQSDASVDFLMRVADQRDRDLGLTAEIDADALLADDQRHEVVAVRRHVRALLVDRRPFGLEAGLDRLTAGRWLERALAPTERSPTEVVEVEPAALDAADLRTSDVVLAPRPDLLDATAWRMLAEYVREGGLLLVSPPGDTVVHAWAEPFVESLGLPFELARETVVHEGGRVLAEEQPASALLRLLSGELAVLTAPVLVERVLPPSVAGTEAETILVLDDGTPLLVAATPSDDDGAAQGLVLYLAVAPQLSETNLPSKPLMVPLLHEVVRQGLGQVRGSRTLDVGDRPPLLGGRTAAELVAPSGERLPINDAGVPAAALHEPGLYRIVDAAGQPVGRAAVNVDPRAGRTDTRPESSVLSWLGSAAPWSVLDAEAPAAALMRTEPRSSLARMLLLALLALLLIETVCARWFSHAFRHRAEGALQSSTSERSTGKRGMAGLAGGAG